jgi:hypothetical protein
MVMAEPPAFLTVSEVVWLVPTETLPKPMLDGLAETVPGRLPVPVNGTTTAVLEVRVRRRRLPLETKEFIVTDKLPLKLPLDCGAKATLQFTL